MKNIRLSFVLAVALVGGVFTAKAQTADEIIQKHIAAIGGRQCAGDGHSDYYYQGGQKSHESRVYN